MPSISDIIDRAFADTVYPGDDDLTVYKKEGREYDETWKLLRGKDWRVMPVYDFITGDTPIPDLTPQAFHYYLPALLKASLSNDLRDWVLDAITFYLNPKSWFSDHPQYGYDSRQMFESFLSSLTKLQAGAVLAVVEEWRSGKCLDEEEYRELLEAYEVN